jgi:hypothetical protein
MERDAVRYVCFVCLAFFLFSLVVSVIDRPDVVWALNSELILIVIIVGGDEDSRAARYARCVDRRYSTAAYPSTVRKPRFSYMG